MSKKVPVPKTPANVRAMAETLATHAAELTGLAEQMVSCGFETLPVTNDDQRRRGLEFMEKYVGAVRTAVRVAREHRGDYGVNGASKKRGKK